MGMLLRSLALSLVFIAAGCGTAVNVASGIASRSALQGATGIGDADLADLKAGRIGAVRERYESQPIAQLSPGQRALLCDIELKYHDFDTASACLDQLAAEGLAGDPARYDGKRALIALALGDTEKAIKLSAKSDDTGSVYVHALAAARGGDSKPARAAAARFAHGPGLKLIYYAASLYSAAGDYGASLKVLKDPVWGLSRDYGVLQIQTILGTGRPAPFRLDLFDEFSFGWVNQVSYAPAANVYIELLAAHDALELGNTAEAVQRLDALLAYPELENYRDVQWQALFDRGRAANSQGQPDQAIALLKQSVAVIESMRKSISSDEGRIGFASRFQSAYALLVTVLTERGQTEAAFSYAERARSRALVDLLASRTTLAPAELSPVAATQMLNGLQRAEGEALLSRPDGAPVARTADTAQRRAALVSLAPSLGPLISVAPVELADIRARLAPNETALAYFNGASRWYCFVVSQSDVRVVTLPDADLNRAVLAFRALVFTNTSSMEQVKAAAQGLYATLVRPAEPYIRSDRVVIAPYGVLHYLPFAALHDGTSFWVERMTIRSVPSLTALTQAPPLRGASGGSLVIGNPARTDGVPPLPHAEEEARNVARLLPQATVFVGADATLANFRTFVGDKRYVHLATHGEFVITAPLQSRILFTSSSTGGDLTVADLYGMRMNAALVTLSACESGLGRLSDGDEYVGLVRGFLFAGSRSVVATLWEIPDASTAETMVAFYKELAAGQVVAVALRRAQMQTMARYQHPFYWAAFVPSSFGTPS